MAKRAVILVPNWSGGIDRLFENINSSQAFGFRISLFNTHGRSLKGLSFLPFGLVYYTSAVLYSLLLPFRLSWFFVLCAAGRVDICHVNLSTGASTLRKYLFSLVCRIFGIPYVVHLHGGDYRRFHAGLPRVLQRRVQSLFRNAARVLVLGAVWRDYVIGTFGVASARVVILPNAVDGPDQLNEAAKELPPRILFLGRLTEEKGLEELVEALSDGKVKRLAWTATLAGDGEIARYANRIRKSGLAARIDLPGWLSGPEVSALLERASIFVLPSHFENLPLSMLEAMAHGLCCIVTPVGSVEDVITDGVNGKLVPVNDAGQLASAIAEAVQNEQMRRKLGHRAREDFVALYDYSNYRNRLETIYRSALLDPAEGNVRQGDSD